MNVKLGNSQISLETFASYLGAVQVSNARAAMFVERAGIVAALSQAEMPAQILGNMRLAELATLPPRLAEETAQAIRHRIIHVLRAEKAPT